MSDLLLFAVVGALPSSYNDAGPHYSSVSYPTQEMALEQLALVVRDLEDEARAASS